MDEPSSGRARKDVNYVPVPSASLRAKPPLPSASTAPPGSESAYDDDLVEDMATPTRTPNLSPATAPAEWQPLRTGPIEPIAPPPPQPMMAMAPPPPPQPMMAMAPPPPSQRHFAPPPSQQSIGPVSAPHSVSPQSAATMHGPSSGRVRQVTPMDAPPYSSPSYPSQQHITGPQMPVSMHPNTGSFPAAGSNAPLSRPGMSAEEGVPLGYVVASAFFLAIALVGFGLYLAFEVISL